MDSSHVLVHVRAVLGAVIAVYASETSLVEIAVGAEVAHHAVPREETVGASGTVEPRAFFRLLLTLAPCLGAWPVCACTLPGYTCCAYRSEDT